MTTKPKTRKAPVAKPRKANIVPFPKTIDPMHKQDVEEAEQISDTIGSIIMRGMRKSLAEAEVKAALGDPDAKDDVEYYRLSIKRQIRDQDSMRANATAAPARVRAIVRGASA